MAVRTRTLAELRAEVRQRADCENDPHITDAELTRYINQSCAALYGMLLDAGCQYYLKSAEIYSDAIGKVDMSALSAYRIHKVSGYVNGTWMSLPRANLDQLVEWQNAGVIGLPTWPAGYILVEYNSPLLVPAVSNARCVVLYSRAFLDMSSDSDAFDGQGGWEEWAVLDAAIKCLVKAEESTRDVASERTQVWQRISAQLGGADYDHPPTVRDTERSSLATVAYGRGFPWGIY